jgi:hypothetical protein
MFVARWAELLQAAPTVTGQDGGKPLAGGLLILTDASDQVGLAARYAHARQFFDEIFGAVDEMGIVPPLGIQVCACVSSRVPLAIAYERTTTFANRADEVIDFVILRVSQYRSGTQRKGE